MWNYKICPSQRCWESVWRMAIRPQPLLDWASGWKGEMVGLTRSSSCGKFLRCLCPGFHEWEFPLHGVWGNLAELYWGDLVRTPRRAFPRIPSAGSWGAVALRDRGRKLYPGPGGQAGTSEAEADPKPSG